VLFAVSTNITSFTIYSNQLPVIDCNLPWYSDPVGMRERGLFSPVTIVVDGVIVIVVVAAIVVAVVYFNALDQRTY